jgi:hypothetical protein
MNKGVIIITHRSSPFVDNDYCLRYNAVVIHGSRGRGDEG